MHTLRSEKRFSWIQWISILISIIAILLISALSFQIFANPLNSKSETSSAYVNKGVLELLNADNSRKQVVKGDKIPMHKGAIVTLEEDDATLILPGGFLAWLFSPEITPITMVELTHDGHSDSSNTTIIKLLQGNIIVQSAERSLYQNTRLAVNTGDIVLTISNAIASLQFEYDDQYLIIDCFSGTCFLHTIEQNIIQLLAGQRFQANLNSGQASIEVIDLNSYQNIPIANFIPQNILDNLSATIQALEMPPIVETTTLPIIATNTPTTTITATPTPTLTATNTPTPSPTLTPTNTPTLTPTRDTTAVPKPTRKPGIIVEPPVDTPEPTTPPQPTDPPTLPPPVTVPPTNPPPITSVPNTQ